MKYIVGGAKVKKTYQTPELEYERLPEEDIIHTSDLIPHESGDENGSWT